MMLKLKNDQRGIAALLISILLVLVSSLIVYGFAEISDNNQQQALTNLLSTQANDAAESGVNKALQLLQAGPIPSADAHTCTQYTLSPLVSVSCLLINANPMSVTGPPLAANTTTAWQLNSATGFKTLTISWTDSKNDPDAHPPLATDCNNITSADDFLTYASYVSGCDFPAIQIELATYPAGSGGSGTLLGHDVTYLLIPSHNNQIATPPVIETNGTGITYTNSPGNPQTPPMAATCKPAAAGCTITLTANNNMGNTLYVRATPLYLDTQSLTLTATDPSGNPVSFQNDEAIVDSTGVADHVSSRIVATYKFECSGSCVSLSDLVPTNALESNQGLCADETISTSTSTFDWGGECTPTYP